MRLLEGQPSVYEALLPAFFRADVPEETKATCARCPMCADHTPPAQRFRRDTKCCTYHPKLPNYLVGGLLADPNPALAEGQKRIRDKIGRRTGITPQWIRPPARYDVLYERGRDVFGRARSLRCPYYVEESGACSVWAYRESVCSTFYCRYVGGADGRAFWMECKRYLSSARRRGWVDGGEGCDDADPSVFPGADDPANGVDDDCDGSVDEEPSGRITCNGNFSCAGTGASYGVALVPLGLLVRRRRWRGAQAAFGGGPLAD